ncbi:histidinol-phosphate transaminase [Bordetella holmesii]|uniref:Histidinol-phosphate aminotransferase n=2 Tax=Bordetella holmesii TaxID=35814 RepID=A0A158M9J4_9BORD|nr:histidinol-phosphate transaminase [Bordetella holmesii]AHV91122.1 histidinol-phosphate transaminase [Bordetella holmesii ATCC 51541]EWM48270.1 histidinol-phosphate transaminase [Bordetella holmesii 41130]EWM50058.1 histidinol-phosphate transaminase [Bordetella holmesii 35009]AMD44562.1 histidinol-phosphate aminotransferase [Bordetella holmesii H558]AMD49946.1 aspartate aminotransferase [Bordetella holmesii F627]
MSQYWSPVVATLSPYVPGEQPKLQNLVKLNTNENPYPPSPKVLQAIRAAASDALRLYPYPTSEGLCQAVARALAVEPDQVFVGNGSDEILAHAFQAFFKHDGRPLLFPDISYSFYPVYCGLYQIEHQTIPLDESYGVVVDDYLPRAGCQAGGVILPNPNAPTGRALSLTDIERLVTGNPQCVVLIDEAYVDFGADSAVALVGRHPNLLVVQTLSKSRSLAGLRVGFAIGHPALIDGLKRVKDSFNSYPIDRIAAVGATAAMDDKAYFERTRQAVMASRQRLVAGLEELGFDVLPSAANFVFARHPAHDGGQLAAQLRERNIIVRHFKRPRIDQFLRITVGTDADCSSLIAALKTLLN